MLRGRLVPILQSFRHRVHREGDQMMVWRTLSTRVVFSHPRHEVHEDEVELPDGRTVSYIRVYEAGVSVNLLCRRNDGRILLQREYSYPPNRVMLELPG